MRGGRSYEMVTVWPRGIPKMRLLLQKVETHRKQGTKKRESLFHGQDREQNFVKFFVKLCATGTPNTPVRSSLLR